MAWNKMIVALPTALLTVACGGGGGGTSSSVAANPFLDSAPAYSSLSIDEQASDATPPAPTASVAIPAEAMVVSPVMLGASCHPHLFIRQREVVERLNRHIYKALKHVDDAIAAGKLTQVGSSATWEVVKDGVDVKFTITLIATSVYSWELDMAQVGQALLPVMTGQIDRTGATLPREGKGNFTINFANLYAANPADKVTAGTLVVDFDVEASSRLISAVATGVTWDLDPADYSSIEVVAALSAPRNGAYVYYREPGKGGSIKIEDQMVFACPSNPSLLPADAQMVTRWYRPTATSVHGRSDAYMTGGQLPDTKIDGETVDHIAAVTCTEAAAETDPQLETFWLMKAEDASGNTLAGESSEHLGAASSTACDSVFGAVPDLTDDTNDFTSWPTSYTDGTPYPFPGM